MNSSFLSESTIFLSSFKVMIALRQQTAAEQPNQSINQSPYLANKTSFRVHYL
jgi:hypothetical protein